MAEKAQEAGDFSLIIEDVESGRLEEATAAFAAAFSLDQLLSSQMLNAAPIIFASKLTKAEVRAITPKLTELSGMGIEFRLTARVAGKIPKVNWPVRPQFTAGGALNSVGVAFSWDNNAFVCPSCGDTFLFRKLGKLPLTEPPPPPAAPAASPATPSTPAQKVAPAAARARKPEGGRPLPSGQSLEEATESLDVMAQEPETINLQDDVSVPSVDAPLDVATGDGEQIELAGEVEEIRLEDEPAGPELVAPDETAPAEEPATVEIQETVEAPEEEETAPVATAAKGGDSGGGDRYNVFLSKITDRSRQDKVAELISKVKGCSMTEARDLTTRLVIPIAKSVPKDHAEDILGQFKKIKVFGRMTKVK